jgi:hypothetical protein
MPNKDGPGTTTTQVKAGNQPQQHQPAWGNQNQGNQNPQGGNNNKRQGRNNIKTIHPCALCGEFGHYTHHCPQIADFKRFKDSGSLPPSPAQPAPQQAPQQYVQQPPPVLPPNPITHQGVMTTQQWEQSILLILDLLLSTLITANHVFPQQSLFRSPSKYGISPSIGVSSMKGHPHALCQSPYGRNWVPHNSYPLPSHYELMTEDQPLLKGSSRMSP